MFVVAAHEGLPEFVLGLGDAPGLLPPDLLIAALGATDAHGRTALHHAVVRGSVSMVEALLDTGAAPSPADCHGNRPLHLVASAEIARLLLDAGASACAVNNLGQTASDRLTALAAAPQARTSTRADRSTVPVYHCTRVLVVPYFPPCADTPGGVRACVRAHS